MGYKFKPKKAVAKRFKVTKTGKLKRHHSFTSHLMSARSANKRRKLRRSAILFEGHARNMRALASDEKGADAGAAEGAKPQAAKAKKTAPAQESKPGSREKRDKSRST